MGATVCKRRLRALALPRERSAWRVMAWDSISHSPPYPELNIRVPHLPAVPSGTYPNTYPGGQELMKVPAISRFLSRGRPVCTSRVTVCVPMCVPLMSPPQQPITETLNKRNEKEPQQCSNSSNSSSRRQENRRRKTSTSCALRSLIHHCRTTQATIQKQRCSKQLQLDSHTDFMYKLSIFVPRTWETISIIYINTHKHINICIYCICICI